MLKVIHKSILVNKNGAKHQIATHADSLVLDVQVQGLHLVAWTLVNLESEKVMRTFNVYMTGEWVELDANHHYIKTLQKENGIVVHVFEILNSIQD